MRACVAGFVLAVAYALLPPAPTEFRLQFQHSAALRRYGHASVPTHNLLTRSRERVRLESAAGASVMAPHNAVLWTVEDAVGAAAGERVLAVDGAEDEGGAAGGAPLRTMVAAELCAGGADDCARGGTAQPPARTCACCRGWRARPRACCA